MAESVSSKASRPGRDRALVEHDIKRICAKALNIEIDELDMEKTFLSNGGDSIMAVRVMALSREIGLSVDVADVLRARSISKLFEQKLEDVCTNKSEESEKKTLASCDGDKEPSKLEPEHHTSNPNGFPLLGLKHSEMSDRGKQTLIHLPNYKLEDIEEILPCSPMQENILIGQAINPQAYMCSFTLKVKSQSLQPVDTKRLRHAWESVVTRHSSLRTVFMNSEVRRGHFDQIVLRQIVPSVENLEAHDFTHADLKLEYPVSLAHLQIQHRLKILRTEAGEVYLRLDVSHAMVDGQSAEVILADICTSYNNKCFVSQCIRYSDFINYQPATPATESIGYWRQYLAGAKKSYMPMVRTCAESSGFKTMKAKFQFPDNELASFCTTHNVSTANVCQVAWSLVLRQFLGTNDVCFSYISSGRQLPLKGIENSVGTFLNTLLCRMTLTEDVRLLDLLHIASKDFLKSLAHQHVVRTSEDTSKQNCAREWSNTLISYQRGVSEWTSMQGVGYEIIDIVNPTDYDVTLNMRSDCDSVDVEMSFWEETLDWNYAGKILEIFRKAVSWIITMPDASVAQVTLLTNENQEQIRTWNREVPPTKHECLHDQVREQSRARPEATAVCAWDGELTYGQLDAQAEQVAHHLVTLGVGPEVMVALCMDKSKWAVVAMLAILKAGGAVVPLGTQHPVARIEGVIHDTAATIILVDAGQAERLAGQVPHLVTINTVLLDQLSSPLERPCETVKPENAAWVIYTSGSTGTPKGVVLEHAALCSSIQAHGKNFGMGHHTRTLQFSAHTFDVSISDILATLQFGGCVCVPSEADRLNQLEKVMQDMKVDFTTLTSTVAGLLRPSELPLLKTMVLVGEAVKPAVVETWLGRCTVLNAYGPSECCIHSTCGQPITDKRQAAIIGYPLAVCLWVVDESNHNRLCPIGAPGELLIEGPQLARGYLHDAEKTAASFVTDPGFVQQYGLGRGRRMYRTGDLVRQNDDGSLTFLGRRDTQIKIRGQRVEIGEIEYWASQHPIVRDVVVLYPDQGPFQNRLVGIIVLHGLASSERYTSHIQHIDSTKLTDLSTHISNIRQHLSRHVMEYMIPMTWVPLAALPLNISSKVDRLQLSQWIRSVDPTEIQVITESTEGDASQTPATALERQLQELYSRVLNIPLARIALDRSFLALGGDSVTAMEAVAHARSEGLQLAVRDILQSQSISQVAMNVVITGKAALYEDDAPYDPFPLSPIQQRYFDTIASASLDVQGDNRYNQTVLLRLTRDVKSAELGRALEAITAKHGMLRARFHQDETLEWRQRVAPELSGSFGFRVHHLVDKEHELYNRLTASERSLDLKNGPVFTADHVQLANRQLLFLAAHHLVVDLVSWRIILRDLEELLQTRTLSVPRSLSFRMWCQQQRELSRRQVSMSNALPFEVPQPNWDYWGLIPDDCLSADTLSETISLNAETTEALLGSCNEALRTEPVEILLAALFHSFHHCFPNRGIPAIFNKHNSRGLWSRGIDLSDTVGWFTTMTPIHVAEVGEDVVKTLIWTKECCRRALGQELPNSTTRYLAKESQCQPLTVQDDRVEILMDYKSQCWQAESEDKLFQFESLDDNINGDQVVLSVGSKTRQLAVFTIEVSIFAGTMQIDFNFNRHIRDKPAVQGWIHAYSTVLDNLLTRLKEIKLTYTPSDFPLAKLTENDLTIIEQRCLPDMGKNSLDDVEDIYPCSAIQQGILISQMKDSASYNSRRVFKIRPLQHSIPDIEKLIRAWQQVVNRHAILRTVFMSPASTDGLMYQIILKTWRAEVKTIVLSKPCEDIEAYLSSQPRLNCQEDRPSHCVTLCKTVEGHLYGILDISHALADASSSNLLISELIQAYDGLLPPIAGPSYGRYIEYMQQVSPEEDLQFWKTRLADVEPCHLSVATDMMKLSTNKTSDVVSSVTMMEIVDIQALQKFQEKHGITVANIFQLAWALILAEYTNSNRVNYGYLTSGRDVPIEGVLEVAGPMINMMVCSIELMQDHTVLDTVQMVQKQFLEAFEHQRTSLAEIQHALHVTGPLFNTTLSCRREATTDSDIPTSIMFENLMTEDPTEYDVTINVIMGSDKVRMELHYIQSRISTAISTRILGHLRELVCELATNERLQLKDIKGLGTADMEQIKIWNREIPEAVDTCLHDQVYEQSCARPEATAVCAWDGELTYGQLDAQAEQVAHHLVTLGVGPEVMVALCMDKSKWAVVAMLGILKAGGAVVPLGTQHPVTRIKGIIRDTAATVILVDADQAERLAGQAPHLVIVDTALLDQLDSPLGLACKTVRSAHVAWVIYTSGSTGTPKGVVLAHKALCTSIEAHGSTFGMNPHTRILQFAAYTWDVSISDILGTLSFGGCVCIPSEHDRMNNLLSLFDRFSVTLVNLTPTVIRMLNPNDCRQLKTLVAGGEALDPAIIERWSLHARIVNSYGPSECSIISTCHSPVEEISEASIIGNPMNVCLWVVDESNHNRLCPIGAPGELLIEGPQLARGYLNDAEKTAASFVTDPGFVQQYGLGSGRRMYRTGDLVRQNDDGSLTFLGRRDTQVKVRGQRVEIGEIEYWAAQHPAIRDIVILYPKQGPFENRLVGIIVLHDLASSESYISQIQQPDPAKLAGLSTQMSNLRQHLSRHVMEYMIPTIWVPLTTLPLNISSKVDRLQLSQWIVSVDPDEIQVITEYSTGDASKTPATALERRLQELWSRVLNMPISRIALDRSFLALGGDSVTAMEIVSYARSQGLQLAVHDVLQSQSISQLAMNVVVTGEVTLYEDDAPYDPFPLSPIQRLYFDSISSGILEAQEGNQYNQTMLLRLTRDVDSAELGRALEAVTAKHGMLRARFYQDGTLGWWQKVEPNLSGSFGFRVHHLVDEEHELYNRLTISERSLDLKNGPVFTADHVQLANRQLLFLAAHHLVVDLVSWRIILRDLEELLHVRTLSIPRALSFRTWCQQQSEFAKHQVSATNVLPFEVPQPNWDYWGLVPGAYLSTDTISETISLNTETTEALFGQCNEPLRTEPVEILLAALFHSFHQCFSDRIVPAIFNEGHGREPLNGGIDLSDTVGWFTTMTPVYVPDVGEDIVKTLVWTKECRRQTPGRGLPYFTARYLTKQGQALFARHDCMEILMNYKGLHRQAEREGALFCLESLSYNKYNSQALSPVASKTRELAVFTIEVSVLAGTTQIDFNFSRYIHHRTEVQEWVRAYPAVLSDLLARLKEMKPTYTPSDFHLARLTDNDLTLMKQHYLPEMGKDTLDDIEDIYPCSAIQQGILISQMKSPTAYSIRQIFEVRSLQDSAPYLEKVISAWQQVVDRHAILRTVFMSSVSSNGMIHQVVLKSWKAEINTIIFSEPCKSIEAYLSCQPRLECREDRPSHRVTLCKTVEGRLFGILDISHTLSDASSINLLISELIQAYDGRLPSIAGPSYGKYIEYLQQVPVEEDLQFWKTLLADIEPCHLPMATHGLKLIPSTQSNIITSIVSAEIVDIQALQRFQETHGVAMANIFQLAWALILAQYTNSDRVNYGYLTNGRDVPIERVLEVAGPMINMMVCSVQLIQDDTVLDAVQKVKKQFLESFQHQRTPLAEIQHALPVTGPLFNTTLSCKREATASTGIPASITFENLTTEDPTEYDLNMNVVVGSDTIQMTLQYIPSGMSRAAAARILGYFRELVFKLTMNEGLQLKDIKGLGASDIEQIRSWNHKVPPALHACLHDQVREQSRARPEATAVCAWDGELTYGQLDAQAEQVAHHLVTLGVGPEVMVALCMDKSKWAVVAMLAILKAGGAVVPLGTQHPVARIEGVIRDTAATIILVDAGQAERLAGQVPHLVTINTALLDQLSSPLGRACETVKPENAAWVIYTSGSTGTPKGVIMEHMALHTTLQAHREAFGMDHHTRSLQFSAHVWDVSISDILGTLQFGGCVCVPSEEDRLNRLEEAMQNMKVNFATLTSTVAGLLRPSAVPLLKTIILVGEAVKPAVVELWLGHCMMVNAYGPTECALFSTAGPPITDKSEAAIVGHSMGRCLWVVDPLDHNRLCPIGAPGELLIEGYQLARGYLHDAETTAATFVTDPGFVQQYGLGSGRRMYRTGDLVRQNDDGSLIFIGRRDTQIKIRGQRVEIGEIEYWISRLGKGIRTAAVDLMYRGDDNEQALLVAVVDFVYFDAGGEEPVEDTQLLEPTPALQSTFFQLYESLSQVLPPYMVPSLYVPIVKLPLNTSCKLDRQAVQALIRTLYEDQLRLYLTTELKEPPTTPMEQRLQALWAAIFGCSIEAVGRHDHFFQTGGDSVMAMRMVAAAGDENLALTVADIFKYPRLSDLAREVANRKENKVDEEVKPFELWADAAEERTVQLEAVAQQCGVTVEQIEDLYPCTPLQEGTFAITGQRKGAYVVQRSFRLNENVNVMQLRTAWEKLAELLAILRTRIIMLPRSGLMQVVIRESIIWTERESLNNYLAEDQAMGMGYGNPLVRFALITESQRGGKVERYFVWTAHHSVYDGWSVRKMFELLTSFYRGENVPLSPVPFTRFLRYLKQLDKEDARAFWCDQLEGMEAAVFPPHPHTIAGSHTRGVVAQQISGREGGGSETISIILRAAWALVVAQQTGADEALLAVTLSGRTAPVPKILHILAPTVTTVPVRIRIDRTQPVEDFLTAVQQQAADMMPFEHTGLQNIRRLVPGLQNGLDAGHLFVVQAVDEGDAMPPAATIGLEEQITTLSDLEDYALNVVCTTGAANGSIEVVARFDTRVIGEAAVQMLLSQFNHTFQQLVLTDF